MRKLLYAVTVPVTLRAFLLPYAARFRQLGWRVDAAGAGVAECPQCRAAFDQTYNVDWSRRPLAPANFWGAARQIRRLVEAGGYDLVHVHTPVAGFVARRALAGLRAARDLKVIYTAHGFHFHRLGRPLVNHTYLLLEKLAGRWTDTLVVINREDERMARQHRIIAPSRLRYVPGVGVDLEALAPERVSQQRIEAFRAELGLKSPETRLFLIVAEFNPGKRHRDALAALATLSEPDCHLALAGTGPLAGSLRHQAERLGLADRVHFLGFRNDVPVLVRASCATLLPSEREGLPRSVMESLALATPVIGTDIRGTADLVSDRCGLLVRVGDIDGLGRAMRWVLEHPEEAAAMGRRGRERMAGFDLRLVLDLHEGLYHEVLDTPSGFPGP